ncbi:hypothetical protein FOL47_008611 [Perkinsus chesapeaki]|uniref:Uncharacterized protein n=1 Tax=Perkinsus chesapeaki TaxID=330153 RepID=A0A7J6MTF7_PERCH|nr:hypothetical protein FOL47_008611 [Perkinsus chesapeaki]
MAVCGYAGAGIIPTVSEWCNDNLAGRDLLLSGLAAGNSSATSTDRGNYGRAPTTIASHSLGLYSAARSDVVAVTADGTPFWVFVDHENAAIAGVRFQDKTEVTEKDSVEYMNDDPDQKMRLRLPNIFPDSTIDIGMKTSSGSINGKALNLVCFAQNVIRGGDFLGPDGDTLWRFHKSAPIVTVGKYDPADDAFAKNSTEFFYCSDFKGERFVLINTKTGQYITATRDLATGLIEVDGNEFEEKREVHRLSSGLQEERGKCPPPPRKSEDATATFKNDYTGTWGNNATVWFWFHYSKEEVDRITVFRKDGHIQELRSVPYKATGGGGLDLSKAEDIFGLDVVKLTKAGGSGELVGLDGRLKLRPTRLAAIGKYVYGDMKEILEVSAKKPAIEFYKSDAERAMTPAVYHLYNFDGTNFTMLGTEDKMAYSNCDLTFNGKVYKFWTTDIVSSAPLVSTTAAPGVSMEVTEQGRMGGSSLSLEPPKVMLE